jgi:probable phosphoglycerate mutase
VSEQRLPAIYFIRHGETDWNAEARLQGQRDIPLNPLGRLQAAEAGRRLMALRPDFAGLDYVASPMHRTRETMELMRGAMGLDPAAYARDDRLKELTFGSWEGLRWKDVRSKDPQGAAARERDKWGFVPPGGESYAMLTERVRSFVEGLARDTVVVAHGGVARAFLVLRSHVSIQHAPRVDIWQGKLLVFEGRKHEWV